MKILKSKKLLATVAVGLMISLVAGMGAMTFARYISAGKHTDQATAAKWGFVVTVNAENLFSTDYVKGTGDYSLPTADNNGVAINAANRSLAPGASGSMAVNVSGTAEVLAELVIKLDVTSNIHLDNYYPIKWTLKNGSTDIVTDVTLADLQDELDELSVKINAGASLDAAYTIAWEWAFDVDQATNIKDTLIGYKAQGVSHDKLANLLAPDMATYKEKISQANYDSAAYLSYTLAFTFTATVQQIQA